MKILKKAISDSNESWHCHHRLETHTREGIKRDKPISVASLKRHDLYYNRPASELIFLTQQEHSKLHNDIGRVTNSETLKKYYEEHPEARESISKRMKKKYEDPEERRNVSEQQKKNYEEHPERKEKHSQCMKQYFVDNPEISKKISERMAILSKDPEFLQKVSNGVRRHYEEHPEARQAMSDRMKGRKYSEKEYAAHQAQYEARRGTHLSEETKKKIGDANRGTVHDEEYKRKISESCKKVVHTEEWTKKAADAHRGKKHDKTNMKWFTNGIVNYRGAECPEGYRPGKTNAKKNLSAVGSHWYTDGIHNIKSKECPEGYHRGRTI